jgi:acyl carrier protein
MNNKDIVKIIAKALNTSEDLVTMGGSTDNIENWDSLGHLSILVALDKAFNGELANIAEMATADSVSKIVKVLEEHSLI